MADDNDDDDTDDTMTTEEECTSDEEEEEIPLPALLFFPSLLSSSSSRGYQGSSTPPPIRPFVSSSNDIPPVVPFSPMYDYIVSNLLARRQQTETDLLRAAYEESMATYYEEVFRKSPGRRLSVDSYEVLRFNPESCRNHKCFICMETFHDEEEVCLLQACRHVFHVSCLEEMVKFNPVCALCRQPIGTSEDIDARLSDTGDKEPFVPP